MLWKIGSGLSRLKALIVGLQPHRRWRDDVGANIRRQSLEARIEKIKEEIARLGDLRPGASSQQYNACGSPRCRCKEDPSRRHGPFYQLSYTWHSKSTTRHVRKEDVVQVKQ